jgi:hypothetical protein
VRSRKYMGVPGGVKVDRGSGSSRSRAANQSVGRGDDDIPDKLAAPDGSFEDHLHVSGVARRPIAGVAGPGPARPPCAGVAAVRRCRCSLRGCRPSAEGSRRWWCRSRLPMRVRRALLPVAAGFSAWPAARRSASSLVVLRLCAGWLPPAAWLWSSTGLPFPALPLNLPAHRNSSQPRQHRQQPLRSLLQKEKHPWKHRAELRTGKRALTERDIG